jgi:hypothetical protein
MKNVDDNFKNELTETTAICVDGVELTLMQKYVIWKLMNNYFFFNCSGTGTGKTIAALAAAKFLKLKLIVVTNNSGKKSYYEDAKKIGFDESMMHVINYDKFSFKSCVDRVLKEAKDFGGQFLVFDEVHNVKVNENSKQSDRSRIIIDLVKTINPQKFLIQTATPVVNHVSETESLLLLGIPSYNNKGLTSTARKLKVYSELMPISIAFPKKMMKGGDVFNIVNYSKDELKKEFKSKPYYDRHNFPNKFNAMIPLLKKGTIVYTEFTDGIVKRLSDEIKKLGYTCGVYSGECKDGITKMVNGKEVLDSFGNYDIMVITSAGSTGTNGLQEYFNRMVFFSLPPTWAAFEQAIGRVDRSYSKFEFVEFFLLIDTGDKMSYSDSSSWYKIRKKKIDSDLIRDGQILNVKLNTENRINLKKEALKLTQV